MSTALDVPPAPTRRINDYAGALPPSERDRLERKLVERERGGANQVVVAIFPSLTGESLEDYSIRLAKAWRVGQRGLDNGVIFLIFVEDRKMRLEVGYGLEATLTDATAGSIIRDVVAPRFREGRLADGVEAGLDAVAAALGGTYASPARPRTRCDSAQAYVEAFGRCATENPAPLIMLGVFLVFGVLSLSRATADTRRGRGRGWTGGAGGWGMGSPPIGPSGPWGGSGTGSSSPPDFSGGGGRFGGGGASGSW